MKRLSVILFALALASPALGADNYQATEGSGKTFRCIDVGGVCYPVFTQTNTAGTAWVYGNGATGAASPRVTISNDNTIPTGWPTAANQTTANTSLSTIATNTTNAATTTKQSDGSQKTQVVDGSGNVIGSTSNALDVNIKSGAGSGGTALADQATFTQSTTSETPVGCLFTNSYTTATSGKSTVVSCTSAGAINTNVTNANANGQATMANSSPVVIASNQSSIPVAATSTGPYPSGATPYTATATGTTAATTATLAGAASVTTYICGFSIRANATAAATGNATVTGVITATLNFTQWTAPNASGLGVTEMIFSPCIPASGTNQSIAVVSAAPGSGGVVSVTAWGYKL